MPESLWAQFGIAGGALFALWASVKALVARLDRADDRHTAERAEWREDAATRQAQSEASQARSDAVVEKLTEAIKELRDKR